MILALKKTEILVVSVMLILLVSNFSLVVKADSIDQTIRKRVQATDNGLLSESMSQITKLGNGMTDLAIAGALPDKEARYDSYKSLLTGGVAVNLLKFAIGKSRPPEPIEYQPFSSFDADYRAFPSGHTTTAFALATTIAIHYPKYKWPAYTLATLVGISRLYEDVHWASDVVAGAGLGYASAKFVQYNW